ncbi:oligopeptide ABC transporter permease [Peptoniphilus stercorisuis]|uniref:Peptide/nickel transport system permease protein n=1 Tax=Peptoniphilus stercorisuis TaxID=1436965 RepID=A0ABS4KD88_9FIRM|nr:oligopeptide ABC transporter permease [Peptoniphilus stercorisuis]MBP2025739.1 peptide/nickel transport system permease protein [Peptoniphilus stercorisuis]
MWKTITRRVLLIIPQLFILSILVFMLAKLMPGDALTGMTNPKIDQNTIEQLRIASGYYDPWYVQYGRWITNALQGDFGMSYNYKLPVMQVIGPRAINSLALSLLALIIMYAVAIPVGIFAGKNQGSAFDKTVVFLNFFTFAIPSFVLYLFFILIFGYKLNIFPTIGSVASGLTKGSFAYYMSKLHHMIMPAICIAIISSVSTIQYLRNEVIDAKTQDYVKTARSKGVPMKKVYTHHIFRNSLLPIAAFFGFQISGLLGGSVIAESIFNYQGMGKFFLEAINTRDFSVVTALILIYGFLFLLGSLVSDITMSIVDPRIRIE